MRGDFAPMGIVSMLIASAACVPLAALAMPPDYSWLRNAISESAAQGVQSAWIARLGFLLFGGGVLWLALHLRTIWPRGAYWLHVLFAAFMFGTAAFSHRPWRLEVAFDATEDLLHSITATGMGFAFAFGVLVRMLQRDRARVADRLADAIALLAATALSPLGQIWPASAGLLQRVMFAIAYAWYGREAWTAGRTERDGLNRRPRRAGPRAARHWSR